MVPITARKVSLQDSMALPSTRMHHDFVTLVTLVNVKEKLRNVMNATKLPPSFAKSLTSRALILGAVPVVQEGTNSLLSLHEEINKAGQERVVAKDDQAHVIDWSDPAVLRYHAQLNRPYSIAEYGIKFNLLYPWILKTKKKVAKKKAGGSMKKTLARKRAGEKQSEESMKKQKLEDDIEKEELKAYLDLVPREEFAMEIESLATKYPIVDWKTHVLTENFMYYQIIRADGISKNYKIFSEMLDDFGRQDVMDLHRLVEERYATSRPEGYDLML
ncbi:hypothetical protein Tco_0579682 [Tanacetum coccineum]